MGGPGDASRSSTAAVGCSGVGLDVSSRYGVATQVTQDPFQSWRAPRAHSCEHPHRRRDRDLRWVRLSGRRHAAGTAQHGTAERCAGSTWPIPPCF